MGFPPRKGILVYDLAVGVTKLSKKNLDMERFSVYCILVDTSARKQVSNTSLE